MKSKHNTAAATSKSTDLSPAEASELERHKRNIAMSRDPEHLKYLADFIKRFEDLYNAEPDSPLPGTRPKSN